MLVGNFTETDNCPHQDKIIIMFCHIMRKGLKNVETAGKIDSFTNKRNEMLN